MKYKAQNTVEMVALATLIVAIVFSVIMIYNNKNVELSNLSKIKTTQSSASGSSEIEGVTSYEPIEETAGALSSILSMTSEAIIAKSKVINIDDIRAVKTSDDKDIFDVANVLIDELNLDEDKFNKAELDEETLKDLADVAVEAKSKLGSNESETYQIYVGLLKTLFSS